MNVPEMRSVYVTPGLRGLLLVRVAPAGPTGTVRVSCTGNGSAVFAARTDDRVEKKSEKLTRKTTRRMDVTITRKRVEMRMRYLTFNIFKILAHCYKHLRGNRGNQLGITT